MEKEGKRPFEDTKEFVKTVYNDLYQGDLELPKHLMEFDKPYTQIGDKYYQAEFPTIVMKAGDELPLVMMPISEKPNPTTPAQKRRPNAALLYIFANDKDPDEKYQTGEAIGGLYGKTREMISQNIIKNLADLHLLSSIQTQQKNPLNTIKASRPATLAMRIKVSFARGGITIDIRQMVDQGFSIEKIIERHGIIKVASARRIIANWGMNAPERKYRDMKPIIEKIRDPDTTDEELVLLVAQFKTPHLVQTYSRGEDAILGSVTDLQFKAWGNRDTKKSLVAMKLLKDAGLPVHSFIGGQQVRNGKKYENKYYIYHLRAEEKALEILRSHPEHVNVPVMQVAGEALLDVPNTTELLGTRKGGYIKVGLKDAGGSRNQLYALRQLLKRDNLLFPVVEYTKRKDLYIRYPDLEKFQLWLEQQNLGE